MLQRDFWLAVAEGNLTDEVKTYARERFDKLADADAEKVTARQEIRSEIIRVLTEADGVELDAKSVGQALGVSTQKASYHLSQMAKEGTVTRVDGTPLLYKI